MEVGKEFSSWDSFQNALDQYSQENKVVYIVGTCKPVETANKNDLLLNKFPVRFKYCFARMVCKHFGNYSSKSSGLRPNQRTCKTGCTSSIMVSVNKKRTCLVIKEANLQHSHAVSQSIFSNYSQTRRLQGDERRMASVLLRAGVPLLRVQEFISHACHKDPTVKDLQNLRSNTFKTLDPPSQVEAEQFAFLTDVDKLMAEDPESIVEIINFDLVPSAMYIQTSDMMESIKSVGCRMLQVVTHPLKGKVSVVSIVSLDSNEDSQVLALCVIMNISDTTVHCFFEAFVRNNSEFCDLVDGIILDCSKENAEFLQQLIPQAHLVWSRSCVLGLLSDKTKSVSGDSILLLEQLVDAETEEAYEMNLKRLMNSMKVSDYKDFLNTFEAFKELWAFHAMSSFPYLQFRQASVENHYLSTLKTYIKPHMNSSELIRALLRLVRNEDPEDSEVEKPFSFEIDPSCKLYKELCFHDAYMATQCQIAVALSSTYEIKRQTDMVFIKRKDSEEDFVLNLSGTKCTCPYFLQEELPCQHIFAWLKSLGKPLYEETLIPVKWQVFGTAITLDAIAESIAQGHVPSSAAHDERIKEVQSILKDLLSASCTHSYQQMGRDIILLRHLLDLMKTSSNYDARIVLTKNDPDTSNVSPDNLNHEAANANLEVSEESLSRASATRKPGRPPGKRGRGRPSNKEKLLRMMREGEDAQSSHPVSLGSSTAAKRPKLEEVSALPSTLVAPRHNLRKNIKHKILTSEASSRIAPVPAGVNHMYGEEYEGATTSDNVNVMQVEEDERKVVTSVLNSDRTELYRSVLPKELLMEDNSLSDTPKEKQFLQVKIAGTSKESQSQKLKLSETKRHYPSAFLRPEEDSNDVNDEESCSSTEEENDDDSSNQESPEEMTERRKGELVVFLSECPSEVFNEVLQTVAIMESSEEKEHRESEGYEELPGQSPSEILINSCEDLAEIDFISSYISSLCPGLDQYTYQVASCLFCKAYHFEVPMVTSMLQALSPWPNHLPEFPSSRPFEGEVMLNPGQTLTLCGHKLDQVDMDSLRPGKEISSEIVHAYLEILAQKHSGKMFVLPFSVVHVWRNGSYTDMLFKKVHFKTFDYLVLPIHCGGEFSQTEREFGDLSFQPCWMALVADVKAKTVSILNPRPEDRYAIAANGYMLQWRRYMQIRSVHTREMLSVWNTKSIPCNKVDKEGLSAIMLLMNIEALICGAVPSVMHPTLHSSRYRHHVAVCLRDMDWQTTVLCVGGPECQRMAARDADWLQCENCRAWWHRACAMLGSDEMGDAVNRGHRSNGKTGIFYCTSCRQRIQALKILGESRVNQIEEEEEEEDAPEEDDGGEKEYEEEEEETEGGLENGEGGSMRIDEIHEEEKEEEENVHLILGTSTETEAEEK
ncbi:hypothetical protein EGW08_019292 [Elysia chlorotica]|uniref:SWIM-type domain-containing protein n=1 Tax=Elysia chlorotica TaxID=188477 RepID=A0A3S1B1U2_ELYCH|nr:hypothetical protein EGW08_019292 [Elysia chlorotica]